MVYGEVIRLNHIKNTVWKEACEKYNLNNIIIFGSILTEEFHGRIRYRYCSTR